MEKLFYLDKWEGKAQGGIWFRVPKLKEFMELVEKKNGKVVALKFKGNNVEVIYEPKGL